MILVRVIAKAGWMLSIRALQVILSKAKDLCKFPG